MSGEVERPGIKGKVIKGGTIRLFSDGLLSKHGFSDGDAPDEWYDYLDQMGMDYAALEYPLSALVREFLLPRLEQQVTVYEIGTSHNPIRAETVDGKDVRDLRSAADDGAVRLTPESVEVPVAAAFRLASAAEAP